MSKWCMARIGLITLSVIIFLIDTIIAEPAKHVFVNWRVILLSFIFTATALPLLVAVQLKAPYVDDKWTLPNFDSNFLQFGDPLHFFHLVGFLMVFAGISETTVNLARNNIIYEGVLKIMLGIGLFLGVKISVKLCSHKYK